MGFEYCLRMKLSDRDSLFFGHSLPQRLDAFDLVHGLGGEIGPPGMRARPHGNAFDHEERIATTNTPSDATQLNPGVPAGRACLASRGRQR